MGVGGGQGGLGRGGGGQGRCNREVKFLYKLKKKMWRGGVGSGWGVFGLGGGGSWWM